MPWFLASEELAKEMREWIVLQSVAQTSGGAETRPGKQKVVVKGKY